jgi:hypothetical protein
MNKKLIASIKLVPRFSHQYGPDYILLENGYKLLIHKKSEYETTLNFIDKSLNHPGSKRKDIVTYTYDCTNNNKRATTSYYYFELFDIIKKLNNFLKKCPDFDEQIEKNRGKYFFDFKF